MLLKATFPSSYLGLVEATSAVTKKWLSIRTARYIFMSVKNMPSSQHYIIYSPPFRWTAPLYTLPKRCEQQQPKTGCVGRVFGKPPLITDASTTICTRFICRAAPLCTNLDGNLCPHPYSPLRAPAFFRISRNRVQAKNPHLNKSFGMKTESGKMANGFSVDPLGCH